MANTRDIGRLFFHTIAVRFRSWPIHLAKTVEVDPPFRRARPLVIRYAPRRALVVGWWLSTGWDEQRALLEALAGDDMTLDFADDGAIEKAVRRSREEPDLEGWTVR